MSEAIQPFSRGIARNLIQNTFRQFRNGPLNPEQMRAFRRFQTRIRGKFARSRTVNATRRRNTFKGGILGGTNADQRNIYRKKSMPRKKKRRWRKFVQRVHAVADKDLGLQTVLINDQIRQTNGSTAISQNTLGLALYSNTSANAFLNDMQQIFDGENQTTTLSTPVTHGSGTAVRPNSKMFFVSAVMDVTVRNSSTLRTADSTYEARPEAAIELDLYTLYMRKESGDELTNYANVSAMFNAYDDDEIAGSGIGFNINDRGATPFELPSALGRWGVKILNKKKYFIPNQSTITFQIRDPKRRSCYLGDLDKLESWNRPGWTKVYFMIYKLVPGLSLGSNIGFYQCNIDVGCTRKYGYKLEGRTENREKLLGNSVVVGGSN